jgi:hypothetical protein
MEDAMRLLFFFLALNVGACAATGAARSPDSADNADRLKALAKLGVSATGTGYAGDALVSIQCASSVGDAALDAKAVRRLAHDEIVKLHCGISRAEFLVPENAAFSSSSLVSCIKFTIKVSGVRCRPVR